MLDLKPLPMDEAIKFWTGKVPLSPGEFKRLSDQQRSLAFAVSGVAKGRELSTVMEAIGMAVADGTTFDDFKKCGHVFERRGFGSWRADTIFRTNVQTAYGVGRYEQMRQTVKTRPLWQYSAVNDSRTRPTHAAMNGKVFPADHKVWDTWYPPNGFRCRCGVASLSNEEAAALGLPVETEDPTNTLIEPVDPQTGQKMPARPLIPDPGFSFNPGKTVFGGIVDSSMQPGQWKAMPGLAGPDKYRRPKLANVRPADIPDFDSSRLLPAGQTNDFYLAEFKRLYGDEKLITDPINEAVILSPRIGLKSKIPGKTALKFNKPGHGEALPLLEEMVKDPLEIWLTPQQNEMGKVRLSKRFVCAWKTPDKQRIGGLAVFEVVDGVWQGITDFLPLTEKGLPDLDYMESLRSGILLYARRQ